MNMTKPDYKLARDSAKELLKRHAVRRLPVDPEVIAEAEGIDVVYAEFNEEAAAAISGLYDASSNRIIVNKSLPGNRKTFTIAHELGHFVMHLDYAKSQAYRALPRSNFHRNKPAHEKEADVFAANLLVPCEVLKKYKDVANIDELAELFAVSREVIVNQMDYL